jgi:outer membrane protein assembly factor BamE (lipoprotein component of BamABCDE complex)
MRKLVAVALFSAVQLAGCSLMPERVPLGSSRAEVEQRLGAPTTVHVLPDGQRLQYSGQPSGGWVYNLDLDAQGRLRAVQQVMDESDFLQRIEPGRWTRDDVLLHMGRPAQMGRVARFDGPVWTYRYMLGGTPRLLHVHLDPQGVVRQLMVFDELPLPSPSDYMP